MEKMTPDLQFKEFAVTIGLRLVLALLLALVLWRLRGGFRQMAAAFGALLTKAGAGAWSPVFIDGLLWVAIALFGFMQAYLSSEESYKYCNPTVLFWCKFTIGSIAAACGALKAFRSTTYSESRKPMANTVLPTAPAGSTLQPVQNQPQPAAAAATIEGNTP